MVRRLVFCLDCEGVFYVEMREKRSIEECPNCSEIGSLRKLTQFDKYIQSQF